MSLPNLSETSTPFHTIVLDASPLLLNTPPLSTLLAKCCTLVTTQSVLDEIRDAQARSRLETLYRPFLEIRSPKTESLAVIKKFATKTGDSTVLSKVDIDILALAYDLECERNGGDWRLRREPGQKRLNGSPPPKLPNTECAESKGQYSVGITPGSAVAVGQSPTTESQSNKEATAVHEEIHSISFQKADTKQEYLPGEANCVGNDEETDTDPDGWITSSNIRKHQEEEKVDARASKNDHKMLQVATITGDFAMQNVLLQMNLNLLSSATCQRITCIKQTILRCHGCFATTKEMTRQFCPRCGNPTLSRVTCTTNDKGEVKLHLKANMQWNNRGNVYSIPKPVSGSSNQKWKGPKQGGGQGGWGNSLILTEDQKEYSHAMANHQRSHPKDLMDEDYLPTILSGSRSPGSGKVRVGAGRNINAKKR